MARKTPGWRYIDCKVTREEHASIELAAAREHISMAEYVRRMLEPPLKEQMRNTNSADPASREAGAIS